VKHAPGAMQSVWICGASIDVDQTQSGGEIAGASPLLFLCTLPYREEAGAGLTISLIGINNPPRSDIL
jgi:hypothetical protein